MALTLTPYGRAEYLDAYEILATDDDVERARKAVVIGAMSFGTGLDRAARRASGFRDHTASTRTTTPAADFAGYPAAIAAMTERLRGDLVECKDAREVMSRHDGSGTLHYVDPPYVLSTRACRRRYAHDMVDADHADLLAFLKGLKGHVVLSGYASDLYDDALPGWTRVGRSFVDQGRKPREEVLWLSPGCAAAHSEPPLFPARPEASRDADHRDLP